MSTIPTASMSAYMVVGPTNRNPFFFNTFDSAIDSGPVVGISLSVRGARRIFRLEAPDEVDQTALVTQGQCCSGIADTGFDLSSVPDDSRIIEQRFDLGLTELSDHLGVELFEDFTKTLAFLQDRQP